LCRSFDLSLFLTTSRFWIFFFTYFGIIFFRFMNALVESPFFLLAWIAQSVQRFATGRTVRGSNPGGGEFFRIRRDRPWGPPSLLYNGCYVSFPGGKAAEAWRWTHTPSSVEVQCLRYSLFCGVTQRWLIGGYRKLIFATDRHWGVQNSRESLWPFGLNCRGFVFFSFVLFREIIRDIHFNCCLYYRCPLAEGVDVKVRALVLVVMIQVPRVVQTCFLKWINYILRGRVS
jgi:hypothetical protein